MSVCAWLCVFVFSPETKFCPQPVSVWAPHSIHIISGTKTSVNLSINWQRFDSLFGIFSKQFVFMYLSLLGNYSTRYTIYIYWDLINEKYLVELTTMEHLMMLTFNSCISAHQVDEARRSESPAPWISDRRSGTVKVFLVWRILVPSLSYEDSNFLLIWVQWSKDLLFFTQVTWLFICVTV